MSRQQEKEQLVDLNERFQSYVRKVRKLKDESDIQTFYKSIGCLEDEVKGLRNSYESQISQLKYNIDILMKEKSELERENITKKNSEAHLSDRLAVELNKNQKVVDDLNNLQKAMMQKDEEMKTLNKSLSQAWFDFNVAQKDFNDSLKHSDELQRRLDESESNRRGMEEKIKVLEDKVTFQERLSEDRVGELRTRLENYIVQIAQLDNRVEEANRKEAEMPELIRKIKEAAENEVKQFQRESESYYKDTIFALQNQIESGDCDGRRMQTEMDRLTVKLTEMRTEDSEKASKINCLEQKNKILEQTIETERHHANETIGMLERKLRDLQELMMTKLKDTNLAERSGVSLTSEIEAMNALMTEEEIRLETRLQSVQRQLGGPSDAQSFGLHRTAALCDLSGDIREKEVEEVKVETKVEDLHLQEIVQEETEAVEAIEEVSESAKFVEENGEETPQTPRSPVGPIMASGTAVGPIRVKSAPTSSQGDDAVQEREYFEDLVRSRSRVGSAGSFHSHCSATGDVKILEVNPEGKFIRLWNSSDDKEQEFGGHILQQNMGGHPVAVYRFPPQAKFPANSTITVWAGCNDPRVHRPPTDFLWTEKYRWGTGPETTTILCRPSGQAIAWTTAPHRIARDPFHTPSERLYDSPTGPEERKLPELTNAPRPEPVYLKREKMEPVYAASKHPHGIQPKANVHPSSNTSRPKTLGNDNSSLNRQTRQQSTVPDPVPGEPYAGTAYQRIGSARMLKFYPATLRGSGAIANKAPDVVLRSCVEAPSPFLKPRSRFQAGLEQIRSMHDLEHQPPMPRPPLFSQW